MAILIIFRYLRTQMFIAQFEWKNSIISIG